MKKILVTGAAGFWGSHLSQALVSKGYSVYGTYHKSRPAKSAGIKWVKLDVTKNFQVRKCARKIKPFAICHLAGQSSPGLASKLEKLTFSLNTKSCAHFLDAIRHEVPECRFVYASSIHVYGKMLGKTKTPLLEKSPVDPQGPYGISKRDAELLCLDFHKRFNLDTVVVRPVNCIGKGLAPHFAFSDWCSQIASAEKKKNSKKVLNVGNLNVSRDFLYIEDAVRGFILALEKGKSGEIYNLSSQKVVKLQVFIDFLLRKSRVPITIVRQRQRVRKRDPREIHISSQKLRRLGWRPKHSPFEGLEELLTQYRKK